MQSPGGPGAVLLFVVAIGVVAGIIALARKSPAAGLFGLIGLGLCSFIIMRTRTDTVHEFHAAQGHVASSGAQFAWGPLMMIGVIAVVALLIGVYSTLDQAGRRTMHRGLLGVGAVILAVVVLYFFSASSARMRPMAQPTRVVEEVPARLVAPHDHGDHSTIAVGPDGIKLGPAEMKIGPDGITLDAKTTEPAKAKFAATGTLTTFQNGQPVKTETAPRPDWAKTISRPTAPRVVNGNVELVISTDYYATTDETERDLRNLLRYEFNRYLDNRFEVGAARAMQIGRYAEMFRAEQFDEVNELSVGSMHRSHVLVRLTPQQQTHLAQSHQESRVARRTTAAICVAALVLAGIGTLFGYLKLDTATRGFYSGRLKVAAGCMFALLLFAAFLLQQGTLVDAIRDLTM